MRTDLLHQLLDDEVDVARSSSSAGRPGTDIWRDSETVYVKFSIGPREGVFALDCAGFDADPPSVSMVDPDTLSPLMIEGWFPGVPHSLHPVTGRPFVCIQGVAEYHIHPSHVNDPWDRYRVMYRIPQTISRLLDKAGVAR